MISVGFGPGGSGGEGRVVFAPARKRYRFAQPHGHHPVQRDGNVERLRGVLVERGLRDIPRYAYGNPDLVSCVSRGF